MKHSAHDGHGKCGFRLCLMNQGRSTRLLGTLWLQRALVYPVELADAIASWRLPLYSDWQRPLWFVSDKSINNLIACNKLIPASVLLWFLPGFHFSLTTSGNPGLLSKRWCLKHQTSGKCLWRCFHIGWFELEISYMWVASLHGLESQAE